GSCIIRLCFFSIARNSKIERNFFIVGLSSLVCSLPYMAAMVFIFLDMSFGISDGYDRVTVIFQMPWLSDLKYLRLAPMLIEQLNSQCNQEDLLQI
ncbi:hypothetical protein PMAYCL1PPCAC_32854, partial [Pristionchus mayeri]